MIVGLTAIHLRVQLIPTHTVGHPLMLNDIHCTFRRIPMDKPLFLAFFRA